MKCVMAQCTCPAASVAWYSPAGASLCPHNPNQNHTTDVMGFRSLKVVFIFPPTGPQNYCLSG